MCISEDVVFAVMGGYRAGRPRHPSRVGRSCAILPLGLPLHIETHQLDRRPPNLELGVNEPGRVHYQSTLVNHESPPELELDSTRMRSNGWNRDISI